MSAQSDAPQRYWVPVPGGDLAVARWGGAGPTVIAAHGITASLQSWALVGQALADDLTLLVPDLRGRGESARLPGPYGIAQHADDLAAVLDHAGVDDAVVAGHSMGGSVAAVFAAHHPQRTRAVLLIDGGAALGPRMPDDVDVDAALEQVIGPALARLQQRFASPEEYRAFWHAHPAFVDTGTDMAALDAYADYDLTGSDGEFRSKVSREAVRADARDMLINDDVRDAVAAIAAPTVLLLAERGMFNDETPLYPDEAISALRTQSGPVQVVRVPATNHYTLALNEHGVLAIAHHLRQLALGEQRDA
jgi:pimeloyl-ACP methyl ester carboxylesterase